MVAFGRKVEEKEVVRKVLKPKDIVVQKKDETKIKTSKFESNNV